MMTEGCRERKNALAYSGIGGVRDTSTSVKVYVACPLAGNTKSRLHTTILNEASNYNDAVSSDTEDHAARG